MSRTSSAVPRAQGVRAQKYAATDIDFAAHAALIARELFGEPNIRLSKKNDLRFGTHGSFSIDLERGTWFDFEANEGGGMLDLVEREKGLAGRDAFDWMRSIGCDIETANANLKIASKIVGTFDYVDEGGDVLFQVVKYDPKAFKQRRPDPGSPDGWTWNVEGVRRVLYRLPELIEAVANGRRIHFVEGEKDVNAMWARGLAATCNPGGAGNWRSEYNAFFTGADVVVVADNDPQSVNKKTGELMFHADGRPQFTGQDHAQEVAAHLINVAGRVRVLDLGKVWRECPVKGDVSDYFERYSVEDLNSLVEQLADWTPEVTSPSIQRYVQSSPDFVRGFVPPDYVVDGILQRGFCYSITGPTGHGKTAVILSLGAHVAIGKTFGKAEVTKGRVIYFAGENPDDIRMRWIAASQHVDFDINDVGMSFVPGVFKISEIAAQVAKEVEKGGDVALVIIDTSAAFFEGDDENNNAQQGKHARRLRSLSITLPGHPCVLVACHPVKNASRDNLLPRGGGAYVAEVDGNLTCWKEGATAEVHWQGKFRGPDFAPISFQLRTVTHQDLKDSKGRLIPTVVATHLSEAAQEEMTMAARADEKRLLAEIDRDGTASQAELAKRLGWYLRDGEPYKTRVRRFIENLKKSKLLETEHDVTVLTEKGRKVLKRKEDA